MRQIKYTHMLQGAFNEKTKEFDRDMSEVKEAFVLAETSDGKYLLITPSYPDETKETYRGYPQLSMKDELDRGDRTFAKSNYWISVNNVIKYIPENL